MFWSHSYMEEGGWQETQEGQVHKTWAHQAVWAKGGYSEQRHRLPTSLISKLLSLFSRSVVSNSLRPHRLHLTRLPCSSPSPRACSNSFPLSQWCHPTVSLLLSHLLLPSIFSQNRGLFQWVSCSHQVAKELQLQLQHWIFLQKLRVDFP